ncbi:MAG: aminotransferase class-III, partial [Bacteroidetes bacterium]|nr:aminotransferase class-III [Bacteroidota bacterium]
MNQRELFLRHVAQTSDTPLLGVDMNIVKAEGSVLTDVDGKQYIDLISGISVSNVGHCHPAVIKAIEEQSRKFMHLMVYGEYNQSPQVNYAHLLTGVLPENLDSVYFTTGGSEAVEGAMKLAKRVTGRSEIISFKNAYHGSTQGALSVMGDEFFKNSFRPLLPGIKILEYNNLQELENISSQTAAVIIEPIQGEAGVRAADRKLLEQLRKKCDEHCVLLIFDEIQTGFGRTGTLFAFEQFNVVPDVLLVAKGMGGGLPVGAFIS